MNTISHRLKTPKQNIASETPITKSPNVYFGNSSMTNGVVKSRKKTSLKEFALVKGLRREVLAGFRTWLNGSEFQFDEDWDRLFYKYNHRR